MSFLVPPTKPDRVNCSCGAEPKAHKLETGNRLLAETVRSWGYTQGRQESNGELVGRALWDLTDRNDRLWAARGSP